MTMSRQQQNIKHRDQLSPHSLKPGFNFSNFPRTRFFFLPILCYSLFHSVSLWHFSTLTSAFVHCETISTSRNFSDKKGLFQSFASLRRICVDLVDNLFSPNPDKPPDADLLSGSYFGKLSETFCYQFYYSRHYYCFPESHLIPQP